MSQEWMQRVVCWALVAGLFAHFRALGGLLIVGFVLVCLWIWATSEAA